MFLSFGSGVGFFGFSWNPVMRHWSSTSMMPNWLASSIGIGIAATVAMALFAWWKSTIWLTSMR